MPELPHGEPVQWLWLLHDDCAPEPDALAQLLRVVENERELGRDDVAVVGPKLRGWYDRRQLLEVGVTIANSGRRWTGLDRREQDQGQHDHVRPVLVRVHRRHARSAATSSRQLGGFDRRLPLMRDDVDLCWRATAAGHRVLVAPEAVVRHAEAASRERRTVDCAGRTSASPHKVDKAGAVYTLLVNTRTALLPWVLLRLVLGTLLRTVAYLVGKVPGQAVDEIRGLLGVLLRPERIIAGRRRRGRSQLDKGELRPLFPPPGATVRATVEQVAGDLVRHAPTPRPPRAGRHGGAVESGPGGDDADFLEIEQFARLKRVARKPGPGALPASCCSSRSSPAANCSAAARSRAAPCCPPRPTPPSCGRATWTAGTRSARAAPRPRRRTWRSSPCSPPCCSARPASRSPCCWSARCRWPASPRTSPPARSSSPGCCAPGRPSSTPSCPPPPAPSRAAASAPPSSPILLPLIARAGVAASGLTHQLRRARQLARHLGVRAAADDHHRVHADRVAHRAAPRPRRSSPCAARDITAYGLRFLAQLGTPLLVLAPWSLTLLPFGFFQEAGLEYGAAAGLRDSTCSAPAPAAPARSAG